MRYVLLVTLLFLISCGGGNDSAPYQSANVPVEKRINDLIARMSLEEKIEQLSGRGFETRENKRLGIPVLKMADGPMGVRWGEATAFPAGVGMAATWNGQLMEKMGAAIALELKAKGRNYLLGPCVNIHRHPLGGRNFESYGEDPFLAARMAVAYINGVQSRGVLACVKHYALNNQEWKRFKLDVNVNERALREIYLPAFKGAVKEAGVWSVMAAYNLFRGHYCSENAYLLNDILKKEWGFQGIVVSDWNAVKRTVKAANAGLDLEMPTNKFFGPALLKAVKNGSVSEKRINDKVRRLMRVRYKMGLFDKKVMEETVNLNLKEHNALALQGARESIVLLKNRDNVLPLDTSRIKRIAVIGPNALEARVGGGGSSKVTPRYAVSPLHGLKRITKEINDNIEIEFSLGIAIRGDIHPVEREYLAPPDKSQGENGLWAEYFSNDNFEGKPVFKRLDSMVSFEWGYDTPLPKSDNEPDSAVDSASFSVRWRGKLLPPKTGVYKLGILHNDGARLYLDDKLIMEHFKNNRTVFKEVAVPLTAGKAYGLRIDYFCDGGVSRVKFGWKLPEHDALREAVELAKKCDAAIIFAGLHARFESEEQDRRRFHLPNQDILIEAVAKANPNTVVVMETGTPVRMTTWINDVAGVLQAWYPGQEGGRAIAEVLFGKWNPSGKLPVSFIAEKSHSPAFKGYGGKSDNVDYREGLFVGYRYLDKQGIRALFPFGHGLSYTSFNYSNPAIRKVDGNAHNYALSLDIGNTGKQDGAEVVQVYISDLKCTLERPKKELKGFEKIFIKKGETKRVTIFLDKSSFSFYHPQKKKWIAEPGKFKILVGSSSEDIRLEECILL